MSRYLTVHADALVVGNEFYEPASGEHFRVTRLETDDDAIRVYALLNGSPPGLHSVVLPDTEFLLVKPPICSASDETRPKEDTDG